MTRSFRCSPKAIVTVGLMSLLLFCIASPAAHASIAYGSINNFDTVNDTGQVCHGFEIEIEDCRSTDITYTYNYNHYGAPNITEDHSVAAHPKTTIRWESKKNPDGSWAAYTAIPSGPIAPTNGHMFTNPAVNFGGEHFGAGYNVAVGAVRYNWLVDNGSGVLIHGGAVQVSTPTFTYYPPAGGAVAQVQAVIQPPPPPAPPPKEFGKAVWVKEIKTTTHNNNRIKLRELVSDDPNDPNDKNWANGEPDEVEVEWRILQTKTSAPDGGPNNALAAAAEGLPNGDEVVTRRYEFYKYTGPLDAETGEAMADLVGADGIHGSGSRTYADHFAAGEWVTVTEDMATKVIVGDYTGSQMAAVDVAAPVGLIDHVGEGRVNTPFAARTVVIEGALPFAAVQEGQLPPGMTFDDITGILSGTPTASGSYQFTITAADGLNPDVSKNYTLNVAAAGAALPPASLLDTQVSPVGAGTTTGDGSYDIGAQATVTATAADGYTFLNWSDNGKVVSVDPSYTLVMDVNHSLAANFGVTFTIATSSEPPAGGSTSGGGTVADGQSVTVIATPNAGYTFTNWTEGANVVSATASYTFSATADRNLVAHFTQGPVYTVSTSASPGAGGSVSGGGSFASGASVTVSATANPGYAFVNWTENGTPASGNGNYTFNATANRNLVANFVLIGGTMRTIATSSNPPAGGTTSGGGSSADGTSATVIATANAGYRFSKWKEGDSTVSTSASYTFTVTADASLVAIFDPVFTVTAHASPLAGGTTEVDSSSYKPGETATVKAFPASGYEFVNWTENGTVLSNQALYSFPVNANRSLVANFAIPGSILIAATSTPLTGGTTSGGGSYLAGNSVTVSATAAPGYAFVNWTEGGAPVSSNESYTFTASANRSLIANFALGYTVTANAIPAEGGSVSGGGFVAAGNSVTLAATANPGYVFSSWTDAIGTVVSSSSAYTYTPVVDGSFTANFAIEPSGILFDFDTPTPALANDQKPPFDQTASGYTASFTSPAPDAFRITTEAASGEVLGSFGGQYVESLADQASLVIRFAQSVTGVSVDFATIQPVSVPVAADVRITAIDNSSGMPIEAGVGIAHGTVKPGDTRPTGKLTLNPASGSFDEIRIQMDSASEGAIRFLLDNLSISPASSTGGSMQLANPNWNITLSDFGYSDFLLDNTPGFEGREYLSGEWGSAVAYTRGSQSYSPVWLEPKFLYPDWQTNSNFHVVNGIHLVGTNADGLPIAESVIANNDLQVILRFEMLDTVTGTPMGISPASAASGAKSVNSNRYVLKQSFTVTNLSGESISGLQLFQLLHGLNSQHGEYDNRSYPGKLSEYQYDLTMAGVDASAAGNQSSSAGVEDLIGFHSKVAPTAFEVGHYGIEGNGIDDHSIGKPSDGVHLSVEDNWQSPPFIGRKDRDSFSPSNRWVSAAQRWDLGSIAPGQSANFDLILSLLTGTKVLITGGGNTGGGGSCNGGSSHVGGVDFEFESIDQEGTFFGEFSEADDNEMLEREDDGEFSLPTFETPNGTTRQTWNLRYNGSHTGNIRLRFAYDPALLPANYDENQLAIYHFRNGLWEKLQGKVDPTKHILEAVTPTLSPFLLGVNDTVVFPSTVLSLSAPDTLEVSWPDSFTGWTLQESANLVTWTNSTRAIGNANGVNTVSVPRSAGMRFFRLLRP